MTFKSHLKLGPSVGAGHFGQVHRGTDDVHGNVAVKILRQRPAETQAAWNARKTGMLHEGQRMREAAHANVVRVHQLLESEDEDAILLVMEYCENGSLQSAFEAGPMTLSSVLKAATEVCLGLDTLHARGMLHRDIKPGNILIRGDGVACLGDFGLVTNDLMLGYGSQAGYSDHIAYEVWHGGGTSVRTDVWALGMTVYRLIHGHQWCARLPGEPKDLIPLGGFARCLPWLPHVPESWRRVIRKMMRDDPRLRYQSATDVLGALATLSCGSDWRCSVTPHQTRWVTEKQNRRLTAEHRQLSPRRHEWTAGSEPLGVGRVRTLGGSGGPVSRKKADRQLREFFDAM